MQVAVGLEKKEAHMKPSWEQTAEEMQQNNWCAIRSSLWKYSVQM
jgi:hypothetical protein